jgi:GlpG protein
MRLLGSLNNVDDARLFCTFLTKEGIENSLEVKQLKDWGEESYGTFVCHIWITDEDSFAAAQRYFTLFQNDRSQLDLSHLNSYSTHVVAMPEEEESAKDPFVFLEPEVEPYSPDDRKRNMVIRRSKRSMTVNFILACALIFFIGLATKPSLSPKNYQEYALEVPLINQKLLYDYPKASELLQTFLSRYSFEGIEDPNSLSAEGKVLWQKYMHTPVWHGVYPYIIHYFSPGSELPAKAPMFEKIRIGELWRLFSPIFLHADIFHLIFNMLWLAVLGIQIEPRIGTRKFLIFVLSAAIFSNTAQYLMSGPNFLGFSGVLCAMLTFIWIKQKKEPWEGYQMQNATFVMIAIFILAMATFQLVSFGLEISGHKDALPISIANTAHLSGALFGVFLAYLPYFKTRLLH